MRAQESRWWFVIPLIGLVLSGACWWVCRATNPWTAAISGALAVAVVSAAYCLSGRRVRYRPAFAVLAALALAVDWGDVGQSPNAPDPIQVSLAADDTGNSKGPSEAGCVDYTWDKNPAGRLKPLSVCQASRSFLEQQYETATKEIRKRVENENTFFILKFTLVGAILAALFSQLRPNVHSNNEVGRLRSNFLTAAFFFAATIVSAVLDVRIQFNAVFIQALGQWVQLQEVLNLGDSANVLGWEHHLELLVTHQFYPLLRLSSGLLTILLFALTIGIFYCFTPESSSPMRMLKVTAGGAVLVLLALVAKSYGHTEDFATMHVILWATVGLSCLVLPCEEA